MATETGLNLLHDRRIDWDADGEALRRLFETSWKKHPILRKEYFDWQFLGFPGHRPLAYCAAERSQDRDAFAGAYIVIPTTVLADHHRLSFSTSLYTITHPQYYRRGIFARLAERTFRECRETGVVGTVGVPNNNSLPGFVGVLGFRAIGQFHVVARIAKSPRLPKHSVHVREVATERHLSDLTFDLSERKAQSGIVLAERSKEFIAWRFLHCPGAKYHVLVAVDGNNRAEGMAVLRFTTKKAVPLTVLVDFALVHMSPDADLIAQSLFSRISLLAWKHFCPLVITLVNPHSYEGEALAQMGFRRLSRAVLPHDSNFIIRLHGEVPENLSNRLYDFKSWYFSFADYDIF
jgi:GNAT superfamily N-acetyltransferase